MASLFGFGVWVLVQSTGVSGTFESSFDWRWNATAEQRYLETLAQNKPMSASNLAETTVPEIKLSNSPWPSFRGPLRDGKLAGVAFSEDWKSNKPKLIWRMKIGPGWSSFSIASNRLFTQEQRGDKEAAVCLNSETGETIYVHEYTSRFWESLAGAGPRATPTVADDGLYCMGADGILSCLSAGTGAELWHRDLKSDSGRQPPMWGFSSSPLIVDGVVIVHAGGKEDKGLLAYKAKTGEPAWSVASGDHSYSSPQFATWDGVSGVLMETNAGLQFLNAADGSKIWQYDWPVDNYRTLQPLVFGNSVLIATGLGGGTRRISVDHQGGEWTTKEDWTSKDMKPDFNDFVEHQGFLYGFDGSIFGCINLADGKRQWKKGRYGNDQVLLLSTAGQLLVTSETGELVLLRADENQFVELAKFQAIDGKTWNHTVVLGSRVFVRNGEEAACYELPR
jgi:outer membrane protein assembly factor BamB